MVKSKFKLSFYAVLLLVLLFSLVNLLTELSGKAFSLELLGIIVLLFLSFIGFLGYKTWGERVLFFVFLLYLINVILMWYFLGKIYVVLLIIALAGFLLAVPRKKKKTLKITRYTEPYSQVFDSEKKPEVKKTKKEQEPSDFDAEKEKGLVKSASASSESSVDKSVKKAKAVHNPGKYVASKNSNNYHEPKCEWAKKIAVDRRVWFKSKEEAWEKGFKAHSCIDG